MIMVAVNQNTQIQCDACGIITVLDAAAGDLHRAYANARHRGWHDRLAPPHHYFKCPDCVTSGRPVKRRAYGWQDDIKIPGEDGIEWRYIG